VAGQLGFGMGTHGCLGMAVARLKGEILLGELARRAPAIGLAGEPVWTLNNTLRGFDRLSLRVTATS
jgi:cytochrome P450